MINMAGLEQRPEFPQEAVFKPFDQVQPQEITDRVEGYADDSDGPVQPNNWLIHFPFEGLNMCLVREAGEEPSLQIYGLILGDKADTFEFRDSNPETILKGDSVTFVGEIEQRAIGHTGYNESVSERIDWLTIAPGALSLMTRSRTIGQPWPSEVTPDILKAAANIAARPPKVGSAQRR